jgi:hypothetical protein
LKKEAELKIRESQNKTQLEFKLEYEAKLRAIEEETRNKIDKLQ